MTLVIYFLISGNNARFILNDLFSLIKILQYITLSLNTFLIIILTALGTFLLILPQHLDPKWKLDLILL